MLNKQVGGEHYKKLKIQPLEFFFANATEGEIFGMLKYNLQKYIWRTKDDPLMDLKKARQILDLTIAELETRQHGENDKGEML